MSQADVDAVFGPPHVQQSLDFYRDAYYQHERIVLALRRRLQKLDPNVPRDEWDGKAWHEIEQR